MEFFQKNNQEVKISNKNLFRVNKKNNILILYLIMITIHHKITKFKKMKKLSKILQIKMIIVFKILFLIYNKNILML